MTLAELLRLASGNDDLSKDQTETLETIALQLETAQINTTLDLAAALFNHRIRKLR